MMNDAASPSTTFKLPDDHPGASDPDYRHRRAVIAAVGEAYKSGEPIPEVHYTEEENEVWRIVSAELRNKHQRYANKDYIEAAEQLALRRDRVPQLEEVSTRLHELTGFRLEPVPGLVPTRIFYGALAGRKFLSTQYIRHHSVPFYTPEPDIIHEIVGHANMLASPVLADLYEKAGKASARAESDDAMDFFSRVFWFTLEFGVLWENGELKAYGAGILSSFGEIEVYRDQEIQPFDILKMGLQEYDITRYQPLLFAAESFEQMVEELGEFFDGYSEDTHGEWRARAEAAAAAG